MEFWREVSFFLDTGTYSKRPFTNHCYVDIFVTSYYSRTVLQHTEHKKQCCFTFSRDTGFHTTMVMTTEQPWSESGGLSRVESTGAASVSHTHSWHQSPQDTSDWRVTEVWRSSTGRSANGVYVWGHAFNTKEDTLSIGCETVDKTVCHWLLITCNVNVKFFSYAFQVLIKWMLSRVFLN